MKRATPTYTKRAIAKYQQKFDRVTVNLPKGMKDRFWELSDESINAAVNRLLAAEIERLERLKNPAYTADPEPTAPAPDDPGLDLPFN